MTVRHLRVEEPAVPVVKLVEQAPATEVSETDALRAEVNRWRAMAVSAGERLAYAENQLKDMRQAADDLRARLTKAKGRQDNASSSVNDLQAQLIAVSAERDALKQRVADQEIVKQKVWEYRQSLLDGSLFELFGEYCK